MPARLGHLRLDVADLDTQVRFYTEALGLTVRERATDDTSHYAFLTDAQPIPGGVDVDIAAQSGRERDTDMAVGVGRYRREHLLDPFIPVGIEFLDPEVGHRQADVRVGHVGHR